DRSADGPGLNYPFDSRPYAALKAGAAELTGNLTLAPNGQVYGRGRLHVFGEEYLYLLNKSGVIVGREWGGPGSLQVEGWLQAGQAYVSNAGAASVFGHNVYYDPAKGWVWPDKTKPSFMIYPYTYGGGGSLYIYSTTATNLTGFTQRLVMDANTGSTTLYGDLHVVGNVYGNNYYAANGGAKSGFVADQFVNTVGDTLEEGDVVVFGGHQPADFYGTNDRIPIPEVDLTD